MTFAACCLVSFATLVASAADREPSPEAELEPSVEAGREALHRWVWQYPWYDSETDGVRAVRVSKPWYLRWEWVFDWLNDVMDWFGNLFTLRGGRPGAMSWTEWVALIVLASLVGLLVYLAIRVWRKRQWGMPAAAHSPSEGDVAEEKRRVEALPAAVGRKPADLLEAAEQCYRQGNYAEAIIYLFSHQLVQLDKGQYIRLAKGKTNRQYLRELGSRLNLRRLLEQTMVAFEDVFFGNRAIDRARFESVWSRLDEFDSLLFGETV
jgi:hypothetical protein